jgi:hypothetical protein
MLEDSLRRRRHGDKATALKILPDPPDHQLSVCLRKGIADPLRERPLSVRPRPAASKDGVTRPKPL